MASHKLFFQKNFFYMYFLWFSRNILKNVIFSSKLSQFFVLSVISIFNDLASALIKESSLNKRSGLNQTNDRLIPARGPDRKPSLRAGLSLSEV